MALDDLVNITISRQTASVSRAGFGTGLILGPHLNFLDRVKYYSKSSYATEMVADGFELTDDLYLAVAAYFSQSPSPTQVAVGRVNASRRTITVNAAQNTTTYSVFIESVTPGTPLEITFVSDADATTTEIATGLAAAINGSAEAANVTATPSTNTIQIDQDGTDPFVVTLGQQSSDMELSGAQGTIEAPDVALAAIALEDSDWYAIAYVDRTAANQALVAAWVESNTKLYIAASADSNIINQNSGTDTTSIAYTVSAASYVRTAVIYNALAATTFPDAAWLGRCLPLDAGSITWAYKTLAGITPDSLTTTQRNNALAKYANVYETVAGVSITQFGTTGGNEYLDITRGIDWLQSTMQADIYTRLVQQDKIPYTDKGIASIEALVRAALEAGIERNFIAEITSISVPTAASVSTANKASRLLQDVEFTALLAGAIHTIEIQGVVTV